jgi:hypothetical protein
MPMAHSGRRSPSPPSAQRQIRLERYVSFLHQSMLRERPQPIAPGDIRHTARWEKQLSRQLF